MEESLLSRKVLLVIDDDAIISELYQRMFRDVGIEAIMTRDGEEGLRMAKEIRPDCVILDILMPKLNGIDVLKSLKGDEKTRSMPVLVLTNYEQYRQEMKDLGADDYLIKADLDVKDVVKRVLAVISPTSN